VDARDKRGHDGGLLREPVDERIRAAHTYFR
jgi:hypothetical protein